MKNRKTQFLCHDQRSRNCQCRECAYGGCCTQPDHLDIMCPILDCTDFVPVGMEIYTPVYTKKELEERKQKKKEPVQMKAQDYIEKVERISREAREEVERERRAEKARNTLISADGFED